jgi:two-component system LytT family response regulator
VRAKKQVDHSNAAFYRQQLDALLGELRRKREKDRHGQQYSDRISFKSRDRILFVDVADIEWIESMDNYVQLNSKGKSHVMRETMNRIESRLDPAKFLRIRRSTIVNVKHIKELQPLFNGEYVILLDNGTRLQSSRRYRKHLNVILPL